MENIGFDYFLKIQKFANKKFYQKKIDKMNISINEKVYFYIFPQKNKDEVNNLIIAKS